MNDQTAFNLLPLAAILEDDVVDINGRNRSYLLTAWYRYAFDLGEEHELALTGGIVDAVDYLDQNAYANDEYTQFMNEALVNGPNGFFPSFDAGGAVEWSIDDFHINAVVMQVGENDHDRSWTYVGAEAGIAVDTSVGQGHYRLILSHGSRDFLDHTGRRKYRDSVIFSADQELGRGFGAWVRLG